MKSILIAIAPVAIMAVGVGATVSASSRAAKKSVASCERTSAYAAMSAADCGSRPTGCEPCPEPCPEPCAPGAAAKARQ